MEKSPGCGGLILAAFSAFPTERPFASDVIIMTTLLA